MGLLEGQLRSELAITHPVELARWTADDEDFVLPGGESWRHLANRGEKTLRSIAAMNYGDVVVVTHGGLLNATLQTLLNMLGPMPSLQNGSITRLAIDDQGQFSLVSLNDVEHLRLCPQITIL